MRSRSAAFVGVEYHQHIAGANRIPSVTHNLFTTRMLPGPGSLDLQPSRNESPLAVATMSTPRTQAHTISTNTRTTTTPIMIRRQGRPGLDNSAQQQTFQLVPSAAFRRLRGNGISFLFTLRSLPRRPHATSALPTPPWRDELGHSGAHADSLRAFLLRATRPPIDRDDAVGARTGKPFAITRPCARPACVRMFFLNDSPRSRIRALVACVEYHYSPGSRSAPGKNRDAPDPTSTARQRCLPPSPMIVS